MAIPSTSMSTSMAASRSPTPATPQALTCRRRLGARETSPDASIPRPSRQAGVDRRPSGSRQRRNTSSRHPFHDSTVEKVWSRCHDGACASPPLRRVVPWASASRGGSRGHHDCARAFSLDGAESGSRAPLREVSARRGLLRWTRRLREHLARLDVAETLIHARVAMQRFDGRGEQLVLQSHDGVVRALGVESADALMQGISAAARTIVRTSDAAWRRMDVWLDKRSSRSVNARSHRERRGRHAWWGDIGRRQRRLPRRLPHLAGRGSGGPTDTPIATATLERLRAEAAAPGDHRSPESRNVASRGACAESARVTVASR